MKPPPLYFVLPFILQSTVWRILMRPFFIFFTHFEVHGLENLKDLPGPLIFAPNHSSEIDSVLLPLALPFWSRFGPMFYVLKEFSYFNDLSFGWRRFLYKGWLFKSLGAYPIRPGKKDYAVSLARHMQILNAGGSVCIFPEGGVTKTGEISSAHGGVGYLAYTTGVPVVPVLIKGTYGLSIDRILGRAQKIEFHFLSPIQKTELFAGLDTTDVVSMKVAGNRILDRLKQAS